MQALFQDALSILAGATAAVGVIAILVSVALTISDYGGALLRRLPMPTFRDTRQRVGRGLVLGLEFFVAADLLRTIFSPSLEDLIPLAVIIVLRTILSLSLDYELRD